MLRPSLRHRTLSILLPSTLALPRGFAALSTYAQPSQPEMFSRAVQGHHEHQKKSNESLAAHPGFNGAHLQSNTSRKPGVSSEFSQGALSDLHDAVNFGESESDNDDFLEIEYAVSRHTQANSVINAAPPAELMQPSNGSIVPPAAVPSSSIPIPWSSSPPRDPGCPNPIQQQQQQKKRVLPWEDLTQENNRRRPHPSSGHGVTNVPVKQFTSHGHAAARSLENQSHTLTSDNKPSPTIKPEHTPQMKKGKQLPWDKSFSAVKEEQKELRKQMKMKTTTSFEKRLNGISRSSVARISSVFFSEEQNEVIDMIVRRGKSVFYTGSAGTGKSVVMREVIKKLRAKYPRDSDCVAVTASTGLAACHIEGVTLHSYAGVGLGKETTQELVKKVRKNQKAKNRWLKTKVLIIDEISMVDGDFFDKLEELARKIRNNGRPFGGIQIVATGDFFQLPPVPDGGGEAKFAFTAKTWGTSIQHTILLTQVFRQKDPDFANMLNEMRLGRLSDSAIKAFQELSRPLKNSDNIEATELFPTRAEVDRANSEKMNHLSGAVMTYHAMDSGAIKDENARARLLSNCMAPPIIHLKKGAQVMLIKNKDETLVNGSTGNVIAFMDEAGFDNYMRENEAYDQIHGTFDSDSEQKKQRISEMAFDHKTGSGGISTARQYPLVSFIMQDGSERQLLCVPEAWKIELPNGEVQAQRQQVPLILAWALSIHKAQGQTLNRVKVDLGRVFERGQAYVALSRATTKQGLQVSRFDPKKVMVHPKVTEFYKNLSTIVID